MAISKFTLENGLQVTGSSNFSGSVSSSGGFTGSLSGTASYGQDANLLDGLDSSAFALTGSTNYFKADQIVSGNLNVTASLTASSLTASDLNIDYIDFVPQATNPAQQVGRIFVDNVYNEINTWTDVTGVNILLGQQLVLRAKCTEMATFTKGQVVRINGGTGANATFVTASWNDDTTSADTLGFLMNSGVTNEFAYIIINGYLTGINTAGYTPGQVIFLSSSGNYTNTTPPRPYHEVRLGQVVRAHASVGSVFVRVQNGYELGELHDVYTGSLSPGDLLVYEDSVTTQWTNKKQLTGSYGLTGSLTASVGLSGALGLFPTLTGSSISGTTAQYTTISGSNMSGALIGTLNGVSAILAGTNLTASTVATVRTISLTSSVAGLTSLTSTTGNFTILSGTTTTGSTALFTTVSGTTTTGSTAQFTTITGSNLSASSNIIVGNKIGISTSPIGKLTILTDDTGVSGGINIKSLNLDADLIMTIEPSPSNAGKIQTKAGGNGATIGSIPYALKINPEGGEVVIGNNISNVLTINSQVTASGKILVDSNVTIGNGNSSAATNIGIGYQALASAASNSTRNIAIGYQALSSSINDVAALTDGNIAIGYNAGKSVTTTANSIYIGNEAGLNSRANAVIAIGTNALKNYSVAGNASNVAIGNNALATLASGPALGGTQNYAIGNYTGQFLVYGDSNIAVGSNALCSTTTNSTASNSVAIGVGALAAVTNANNNMAIGYNALANTTSGSNNIAIGTQALLNNKTGSNSSVIGFSALANHATGSQNIAIGYNAGLNLKTGSNNVYIGSYAGVDNTNNNIYISDGAGNLRMFVSGNGNVGVGTSSPATQLEVLGTGSFYSIKFPSVQSSSNNPNTLDDYEEGTWTPSFTGSSTTNFTYSTNTATYTKIGNTVYIKGTLGVSLTGSSAGTLTIGTLPFTSDTPLISVFVGDMYNFSAGITGSINCTLGSTTSLVLYKYVGGTRTSVSVTEMKNNCEYLFSGFYTTTL